MFFPRASERRVLPIVGVCISSSHLHIFSSSHLLIFTSSHLHIFTSAFTSSHLHICSSSNLLIFTSSHLLIFTFPHHLHTFTSSHLRIFSSSHLLIFTSSPLAFLPSCPLALTSSHLLLLSSCPLAFSFFSIFLLKAGAGAVPTRRHETQPFRTKWGSIAKNWSKIAISKSSGQPFRTKWGSIAKNWGKIAISTCPAQPFRTKWPGEVEGPYKSWNLKTLKINAWLWFSSRMCLGSRCYNTYGLLLNFVYIYILYNYQPIHITIWTTYNTTNYQYNLDYV